MEESKANYEDLLATQTRVLGRDHPRTNETRQIMCSLGFAVPSGKSLASVAPSSSSRTIITWTLVRDVMVRVVVDNMTPWYASSLAWA